MNYSIKVENLKKNYGTNEVIKNISFEVNKGEIFALLGVNGAGKTTTLESIEGLRKYDEGNIIVNGKIGIQLQSSSLPEHIKGIEALKLVAKWNNALIDDRIIKNLGIDKIFNKQYSSMSTGQKRKLHLAMALINNPDIVFLDEPTAGLDVEGRISLHNEIRNLKKQGKTIVLASHDMLEIEELCDRIAILSNGKISFIGTVDELTYKIGSIYTIKVKTNVKEETIETNNISDKLIELLNMYKENNIVIKNISINKGSFEEHFIELSKREK